METQLHPLDGTEASMEAGLSWVQGVYLSILWNREHTLRERVRHQQETLYAELPSVSFSGDLRAIMAELSQTIQHIHQIQAQSDVCRKEIHSLKKEVEKIQACVERRRDPFSCAALEEQISCVTRQASDGLLPLVMHSSDEWDSGTRRRMFSCTIVRLHYEILFQLVRAGSTPLPTCILEMHRSPEFCPHKKMLTVYVASDLPPLMLQDAEGPAPRDGDAVETHPYPSLLQDSYLENEPEPESDPSYTYFYADLERGYPGYRCLMGVTHTGSVREIHRVPHAWMEPPPQTGLDSDEPVRDTQDCSSTQEEALPQPCPRLWMSTSAHLVCDMVRKRWAALNVIQQLLQEYQDSILHVVRDVRPFFSPKVADMYSTIHDPNAPLSSVLLVTGIVLKRKTSPQYVIFTIPPEYPHRPACCTVSECLPVPHFDVSDGTRLASLSPHDEVGTESILKGISIPYRRFERSDHASVQFLSDASQPIQWTARDCALMRAVNYGVVIQHTQSQVQSGMPADTLRHQVDVALTWEEGCEQRPSSDDEILDVYYDCSYQYHAAYEAFIVCNNRYDKIKDLQDSTNCQGRAEKRTRPL